jgi:hypothetical protein
MVSHGVCSHPTVVLECSGFMTCSVPVESGPFQHLPFHDVSSTWEGKKSTPWHNTQDEATERMAMTFNARCTC